MSAGPEDILQMQVIRAVRLACPGLPIWHVPNGGTRRIGEARKFKDMGVLKGVADLCLVLPGGQAAFLEMKAGKGRQSPDQKAFQAAMIREGARYAICRSVEDVLTMLEAWGVPTRARIAA